MYLKLILPHVEPDEIRNTDGVAPTRTEMVSIFGSTRP